MMRHTHVHFHGFTNDREGPEFEESKHPRAKNGEFGQGGSGAAPKKAAAQAAKPAAAAAASAAWKKPDGSAFSEADTARLKAFSTPPAWTHVVLNADPMARVLVTGKDSKGRAQSIYSAAHNEKAAAEKFARLKEFNAAAPKIAAAAAAQMNDPKLKPATRDAAAVVSLISETGFRIGSDADTGADVKAHGASTLTGEHVKIDGSKVAFSFIGKKGVSITKEIDSPALAEYITAKKKANGDGPLFNAANDAGVTRWFKANGGGDFKVKDFRTWNGTEKAIEAVQSMPAPKTKAEYDKARLAVGKIVAAHLGNTPAVALEAYIDPTVFIDWSIK